MVIGLIVSSKLEIRMASGIARCDVCGRKIDKGNIQIKMGRFRGEKSAHLQCFMKKLSKFIEEQLKKDPTNQVTSFEDMAMMASAKKELIEAITKLPTVL